MSEFAEYESVRDLASALGIAWPEGVPNNGDGSAFESLCSIPEVREFLIRRQVVARPPAGTFGYLLPRTQIFLNLGRCRDLRGDIAVAAAVYAMTQNEPVAFIATSVRKVLDSVKVLDDFEYEVVLSLFDFTSGHPYSYKVDEMLLEQRFADAPFDLGSTLDGLEKKHIVKRVRPSSLQLSF